MSILGVLGVEMVCMLASGCSHAPVKPVGRAAAPRPAAVAQPVAVAVAAPAQPVAVQAPAQKTAPAAAFPSSDALALEALDAQIGNEQLTLANKRRR